MVCSSGSSNASKGIEKCSGILILGPEGISFSELRRRYGTEDFIAAGLALALSVLFIYMLMAFLFESVI